MERTKRIVTILSAAFIVISILGILGTQFFSGGRGPGNAILFLLLMVIGGSAETLVCMICTHNFLKIIPLGLAIAVALWGTYLYLTSASWANAALADLLCGYCSSAVGALVSIILMKSFPVT